MTSPGTPKTMSSTGVPKTMSSRLLTMKFMQRAAASSGSSSAPSTPPSNDQSSKRRKVTHDPTPPQNVDAFLNQAAIQAAIAEEERKVEIALVKRAEELGDARWVLDVPQQGIGRTTETPLNIIPVGFAQIDSFDAVDDEAGSLHDSVPALRRYNMDKKKVSKKTKSSDSDSNSDSDSESESDSDSGSSSSSSDEQVGKRSFGSDSRTTTSTTQSAIRKMLNSKKSAEKLKATQFAERRRKKEVNLNAPKGGITSISSGGGGPLPSFTCYKCGQTGHKAMDCKRPGNRQGRRKDNV